MRVNGVRDVIKFETSSSTLVSDQAESATDMTCVVTLRHVPFFSTALDYGTLHM